MECPVIPAGWLTLRPFAVADIPWVDEVSRDPLVQRFTGALSPYRPEHARFFVEQIAIAGWRDGRRAEFIAEDSATHAPLGRVGLGLPVRRSGELAYWVDPRARRRGVATGAVRAVCQWAFDALDLDIIEWFCEVGNVASRRVAEKAGFLIEGTLRQWLIHHGARVDAWVGSLLRDEALLAPGSSGGS